MAYRFRRKDRSVEHALRRIAREQVDKAVSSIDDEEDQAATIHDVRRRCKKLRGLIRLVGLSFEAYRDENADFREIGKLLGGLREARVLKDTFDLLAEHLRADRPSVTALLPPRVADSTSGRQAGRKAGRSSATTRRGA